MRIANQTGLVIGLLLGLSGCQQILGIEDVPLLGDDSGVVDASQLIDSGLLDANDTDIPTVTLVNPPGAFSMDTTPIFEWTSTGSLSGFECKIDETTYPNCTSGLEASALTEETHQFSVWATQGGNPVGDPATHTWTVDTTAPVVVTSNTEQYIPAPECHGT